MQLFSQVLSSGTPRYLYEEVLIPRETDAIISTEDFNHFYRSIILEWITNMKPKFSEGKLINFDVKYCFGVFQPKLSYLDGSLTF